VSEQGKIGAAVRPVAGPDANERTSGKPVKAFRWEGFRSLRLIARRLFVQRHHADDAVELVQHSAGVRSVRVSFLWRGIAGLVGETANVLPLFSRYINAR